MTRSYTKELFTPFKYPKREFRSSRKHFKTLSLDESRSPNFDLFSNQEEYLEEEVVKTMAETMEQYMSKTQAEYGSGIARPKIKDKDTIQAQLNNLGREIKKVNEKVYADQVECKQCKGPYYTKDCPLKEEGKTLEESYYTQFGTPFQGGGYRAAASRFYQRNNTNPSYQKRRQSMEDAMRKDYIELYDLNVPLELRRYQVDDLMPIIKEGEVVEEFRARNDARMDKIKYKGNNVVGALMNIPIFVGMFSILIDFAVLEDMDAYRDEGMGDFIFREPFLREVGINAKQFEGMITIYNGSEEVTYQMVRSHSRFKQHTNEQCNKLPPLLKVSEEDKMKGSSHLYQKLKRFYKGVLNLGPEYVRDAKMEEWLTRG
nr:homeodomain-like protein [Tanacetum cinerariifolium]